LPSDLLRFNAASNNYTPHSNKCRLDAYAPERSTFSFNGVTDSGDGFGTSVSDG